MSSDILHIALSPMNRLDKTESEIVNNLRCLHRFPFYIYLFRYKYFDTSNTQFISFTRAYKYLCNTEEIYD
jgi:hypothetical protein